MTDLTDRLRAVPTGNIVLAGTLLHEAADEIDRLQATIAGLRESANLRVRYHAAELADVTAEREHAVEQAAANADEVLTLREQLEGEYDRGYQAAMQRQAVEVDALIAQWPRAKPKGKK